MCKCAAGTCVCCCLSCTINMLISIIFIVIVIGVVLGLLFYFDVFGIQDTNKDATRFFTKTGDDIKDVFKNIS